MRGWPNPSDVRKVAVDPPWILEIPEGWMAVRLGAILAQSPERNGRSPVGEMLSVSGYRGVEPKEYEHEEKKRTDEELTDYRVVRPGQLVVNTMWMNHRGLGVSDHTGHVSPAYRVYDIDSRIDHRFLHHLLRSDALVGKYCSLLYGIRPNSLQVKEADLRAIYVPVPTVDVQGRIANFLDRETAHIDRLIEKKERLIALLEEKRSALITRAVTKGLDPDVPLKDSGVEWIGEIPEHWEVAPLGGLFEVQLGKMLDSSQQTGEHARRYLRNQDVLWDEVRTDSLPEMDFSPRDRATFRLQPGDLLVCEGGDVGRTAVWRGELDECYYQKAIHRVRPRHERAVVRFLYYVMWHLSRRRVFLAGGNPNTIPHLTAVQLRRYRVPTPPAEEQRAISLHLDREAAGFDRIAERVGRAVALLRERRSALITAAVTGQIDVEEYQASHRAPLALEEGQPPDPSKDAAEVLRETEESLR